MKKAVICKTIRFREGYTDPLGSHKDGFHHSVRSCSRRLNIPEYWYGAVLNIVRPIYYFQRRTGVTFVFWLIASKPVDICEAG